MPEQFKFIIEPGLWYTPDSGPLRISQLKPHLQSWFIEEGQKIMEIFESLLPTLGFSESGGSQSQFEWFYSSQ